MIQIGDKVEFSLLGSDGKTHRVTDYEGKVLILYTYPKDNTPGCTAQACGFRDLMKEYQAVNAVVLGLNADSVASHERFSTTYDLPFPLLTDPELSLIKPLGADKEGGRVLRKTYIIDESGVLEKVYDEVSPKNNPDEVLAYLKGRS